MKVYISGALDGSVNLDKARSKYDEIASRLISIGFKPYVPHHKTDPVINSEISASDVFACDMSALLGSDAIVAFLDEPSFGVGAEVTLAVERGIPVIGLIGVGRGFSRFLGGLISSANGGWCYSYDDLDAAASFLEVKLRDLEQLKVSERDCRIYRSTVASDFEVMNSNDAAFRA